MTEVAGGLKPAEGEPRGPVRVLVAEDDGGVMDLLKTIFAGVDGVSVDYTDNVPEALELLERNKIELVWSDLGLRAERTGLKVDREGGYIIADKLKEEKKDDFGKVIPATPKQFILFSGSSGIKPEHLTGHKIDNFLPKPGGLKQIISMMNIAKQAILHPQPPVSS